MRSWCVTSDRAPYLIGCWDIDGILIGHFFESFSGFEKTFAFNPRFPLRVILLQSFGSEDLVIILDRLSLKPCPARLREKASRFHKIHLRFLHLAKHPALELHVIQSFHVYYSVLNFLGRFSLVLASGCVPTGCHQLSSAAYR